MKIETKQVKGLAKLLGYRKKTAILNVTDTVTITGTYWSGGSRSTWHLVDLANGGVTTAAPRLEHPVDNTVEGKTIEIPEGYAIVSTGVFRGKPGGMFIYVRPENATKLLEESYT